jgi:phosphoglycolate phosphatase
MVATSEAAQAVNALVQALIQAYEDGRQELGLTGRALPGADDTLTALAENPTMHQSVLTGNLREVARIKLEVFGLDRFLDLNSGAYGDDNPKRPRLVAIAQQRATERAGVTFDNNHTVLIGDTLRVKVS